MTTRIACLLIGILPPCLWAGGTARCRKRRPGDIGFMVAALRLKAA